MNPPCSVSGKVGIARPAPEMPHRGADDQLQKNDASGDPREPPDRRRGWPRSQASTRREKAPPPARRRGTIPSARSNRAGRGKPWRRPLRRAPFPCGSSMTRSPPSTACASTPTSAKSRKPKGLPRQRRAAAKVTQMKRTVTSVATMPAVRRWPCSSRIMKFCHHPSGFREPLLSGQSAKAMPAPDVVVCPPMKMSTKVVRPPAWRRARAPECADGAGWVNRWFHERWEAD